MLIVSLFLPQLNRITRSGAFLCNDFLQVQVQTFSKTSTESPLITTAVTKRCFGGVNIWAWIYIFDLGENFRSFQIFAPISCLKHLKKENEISHILHFIFICDCCCCCDLCPFTDLSVRSEIQAGIYGYFSRFLNQGLTFSWFTSLISPQFCAHHIWCSHGSIRTCTAPQYSSFFSLHLCCF